jgi:hypothetical protein
MCFYIVKVYGGLEEEKFMCYINIENLSQLKCESWCQERREK